MTENGKLKVFVVAVMAVVLLAGSVPGFAQDEKDVHEGIPAEMAGRSRRVECRVSREHGPLRFWMRTPNIEH